MPTTLKKKAAEESSFVIEASFTDEDGAAVVPNIITWTLVGKKGSVINQRSQVSITPAATISVVLKGADLALRDGEKKYATVERRLLIEGDYDSNLGNNIDLKAEAIFEIENLMAVNP